MIPVDGLEIRRSTCQISERRFKKMVDILHKQVKLDFWDIKSINWFAVSQIFFKQQDVQKIHVEKHQPVFGLLWLNKSKKTFGRS